jgi:hypothetical protein
MQYLNSAPFTIVGDPRGLEAYREGWERIFGSGKDTKAHPDPLDCQTTMSLPWGKDGAPVRGKVSGEGD